MTVRSSSKRRLFGVLGSDGTNADPRSLRALSPSSRNHRSVFLGSFPDSFSGTSGPRFTDPCPLFQPFGALVALAFRGSVSRYSILDARIRTVPSKLPERCAPSRYRKLRTNEPALSRYDGPRKLPRKFALSSVSSRKFEGISSRGAPSERRSRRGGVSRTERLRVP